MEQTLILMCGPPASGKTTYVENKMKREGPSSTHISRDKIRFNLLDSDDSYFAKEEEVIQIFIRAIKAAIASGKERIYIDATHLTPKSRKVILSKIHDRKNLNLEVICFNVPTEILLERNSSRTGRSYVPEKAIINMQNKYKEHPPNYAEFKHYHFKEVHLTHIIYNK